MHRCVILAVLVILASCAPHEVRLLEQRQPSRAQPTDVGDRSEVHTLVGARAGYAVRACHQEDAILGIDCLGAIERPHEQVALATLHRELENSMQSSAVGVGFGVGCDQDDRGFRVYVRRYAEVDSAVERAGQLCVECNTRARFSIHLLGESQLL